MQKITISEQSQQQFTIDGLDNMSAFACALVKKIKAGDTVFLKGDLGAGKTTLCQFMFRQLGVQGTVTSPTFSLVESYDIEMQNEHITLNHFDLYRLESPEELDNIGFRDYFHPQAINFIEWPEKGGRFIRRAEFCIEINLSADNQRIIRLSQNYSVSI